MKKINVMKDGHNINVDRGVSGVILSVDGKVVAERKSAIMSQLTDTELTAEVDGKVIKLKIDAGLVKDSFELTYDGEVIASSEAVI